MPASHAAFNMGSPAGYPRTDARNRLQGLHVIFLLDHSGPRFVQLVGVVLQTVNATKLILKPGGQHLWHWHLFLGFVHFVLNALEQNTMRLQQHDVCGD